jgi:hypothetical protein
LGDTPFALLQMTEPRWRQEL